MSSHDEGDIDINVVSSPEPSPCPSPTNPASSNRPNSDDEAAHIPYSHLHHITRHHSRPLTITSLTHNNNTSLTNGDSRLSPSKTPPDTPTSGTNSVLNSPSNNINISNNNNNNNTSTKNSGFTSFSISNILSRSESANSAKGGGGANNEFLTKKPQNGTQMPTTNINVTTTLGPLGHAAGIHGPHDAAMLSR